MDFIKIQQKIKTDEYQDLDDMSSDIELLVSNAKAFYKVRKMTIVSNVYFRKS